jgi:hypothetical protein
MANWRYIVIGNLSAVPKTTESDFCNIIDIDESKKEKLNA